MKSPGVKLQYGFEPNAQRGAAVQNPLFDLLQAVHAHGSIQRAAEATGSSYRHVWGALKRWQDVLGQPLVRWNQGHPARLTPFAERLLHAETHARARLTPHIEALRAELELVLDEALSGRYDVLTLYASHDLAIPHLRDVCRESRRLHVDLKFAGSLDALRALAEGRCTVAGFHVPPLTEGAALFARHLKPLLKPGRHKLIGCTRRRQGLAVAAGNPLGVTGLADLAARRLRFVERQAGSGTRLLLQHLLQQAGVAADALAVVRSEDSHNAVAAAVAGGLGDAGLAVEAAARAYGLDFVPLADDDYFLVCLDDVLDEPPVRALREALAQPAWAAALAALPGYAPMHAGEVLSLTRALPWWQFRKPKAAAGPGH